MADVFISYHSSDRHRAETLRSWIAECGWTAWMDRDLDIGDEWSPTIRAQLAESTVIVVIWGPRAMESRWVLEEAEYGRTRQKLVQLYGTGLPLPEPFDSYQSVQMQSWSGESWHSQRPKLIAAVAERLDRPSPPHIVREERELVMSNASAFQAAFHYCNVQLRFRERLRATGLLPESERQELEDAFDAMLSILHSNGDASDDREGTLHGLVGGYLGVLDEVLPITK